MLVVLGDQQKADLQLLGDFDENVAREFCKIAVGFIRNGVNPKMYQTAASKLEIAVENVKRCVEGLMFLMTETSKSYVNELDFQDSLMMVGFSEELTSTLLRLYMEHRDEIRSVLQKLSLDLPHYDNLEWRLDVQVASRSMRSQTAPNILLKFTIKDGEKKDVKLLQTDPVNLIHLTEVLEQALAEMKTGHARRVTRNIK
ncbi:COMM domain-containing protein 2-like [Rhopilema esculentum]|uniref:COMM domain-containing protein 2-like n=1 Tax=Rhopilema esculentum TaxID=499914 RepID=UPI0031DF2E5E|eukprot:gene8657-14673_t